MAKCIKFIYCGKLFPLTNKLANVTINLLGKLHCGRLRRGFPKLFEGLSGGIYRNGCHWISLFCAYEWQLDKDL